MRTVSDEEGIDGWVGDSELVAAVEGRSTTIVPAAAL